MNQNDPIAAASRRFRNCILQFGLHGLILMFFWPSSSLAVGDDIRWLDLSLPEVSKNRFEIDETLSISAFARGNGENDPNYDVTLIDEEGRMVRIDVSSGKHWELFPYEYKQKTTVASPPPFKLIADQKTDGYIGRIYYPYGGAAIPFPFEGGSLPVNSVVPYPTRNGFEGTMYSWLPGYKLNLYSYAANRGLGKLKVEPVDSLRIGGQQYRLDLPDSDEMSCRNGQFIFNSGTLNSVTTDRFCLGDGYQGNRKELIFCRRWDGGRSFVLDGRNFYELQSEWDLLASSPIADSKAIVVVYREGLVYYDGQAIDPEGFPEGWHPMHRQASPDFDDQKSLQFSEDGSRVHLLMEGPEGRCELWTFDGKTLKVIQKLPLPSADRDAAFEQRTNFLAVQTIRKKGELFLLFKHQNETNPPTLIGRTSPLTAALARAICWCVSDDEKTIFFVSRPDGESSFKLGQVSIDSLLLKTADSRPPDGSGFAEFSQEDIGFEELPARATDAIVGVLPKAESWSVISPNDRWIVGTGLQLFDALTRQTHRLPGTGGTVAFSADSALMATFGYDGVHVFDVSGTRPVLFASSDRLPEDTRSSLGKLLETANDRACFVSADSVATTNRNGSVRFQIDGPDLKVVYQNEEKPKSEHAAFSKDGSSLAVWDNDGAVVRYKWNEQTWEGVAKVPVPFFDRRTHRNSEFIAMPAHGDSLVICTSSRLTVWNDLQNVEREPLTTVSRRTNALGLGAIRCAAISQNQQWIAYVEKTDNGNKVTRVDRELNAVATQQLPFEFEEQYDAGLIITNDGEHAMVRSDSGRYYVIRLQAE